MTLSQGGDVDIEYWNLAIETEAGTFVLVPFDNPVRGDCCDTTSDVKKIALDKQKLLRVDYEEISVITYSGDGRLDRAIKGRRSLFFLCSIGPSGKPGCTRHVRPLLEAPLFSPPTAANWTAWLTRLASGALGIPVVLD